MVAQFLGLPHVGAVVKLDIADGRAVAESLVEGGREVIEVPLPGGVYRAERAERAAECP